jgi:hypothetical protein
VTIVMGLDQHRAQITFDLLDTDTGEVRGGRVRPADRESFRRFLRRFSGKRIEAALEATTGWRLLVEELRAVGALDGVLAGDRREHPQMRRAGSCQPVPIPSTAWTPRSGVTTSVVQPSPG